MLLNRLAPGTAVSAFAALLSACTGSQAVEPDRDALMAHADTTVRVYGRYVVVRLPIDSGVRIWNPATIVAGPDEHMYVANHTGEIYSLRDTDGDGLEDEARLFADVRADGLRSPAGLAFRGRELYVGTAQEIRVYRDTDGDGLADSSRTFLSGIPHSEHPYEWTSALTFGPDGDLYAVLTTDSWNAGAAPDPDGWRGAMLRISPDGSASRFLTGLRSVHTMVLTEHGDLLFADNQGEHGRRTSSPDGCWQSHSGHSTRRHRSRGAARSIADVGGASLRIDRRSGFGSVGLRDEPSSPERTTLRVRHDDR